MSVRLSIVPPAAGVTAMTEFWKKKNGLAIDDTKAMRVPSGDQRGFESGPFCVISVRRVPLATSTIEMSALPLSAGSLETRWSKAIARPSGDQSKLPTTNAPDVSSFGRWWRPAGSRQRQHMKVRHPPVFIFDSELAKLLLAFLDAVGNRIGHRVGDAAAIRRPRKRRDVIVAAREALGFPAFDVQAIDLALAVPIRDEGQPLAIGRPRRLLARLRRVGQLPGLGGGRQSRSRFRRRCRPSWSRAVCKRPSGRPVIWPGWRRV